MEKIMMDKLLNTTINGNIIYLGAEEHEPELAERQACISKQEAPIRIVAYETEGRHTMRNYISVMCSSYSPELLVEKIVGQQQKRWYQ
jgi:hypothetical protein